MIASVGRLAGAAVAVAIGLLVLWQAGILFQADGSAGGDLQPANTSIETPLPEGSTAGLQKGEVAPDFEFSSFDGERLRLSDFRGQPLLINFWATWCTPCRAEMPAIEEAMRRHESDSVAVLAMNNGERYGPAQAWLDDVGIQLTAFGYDPEQAVVDQYNVTGMPTSYFVDAEGVIVEVVRGPLRESDLDFALGKAIEGYQAAGD